MNLLLQDAGWSAMFCAHENGHDDVVELLLQHGANPLEHEVSCIKIMFLLS